MLKHALRDEKSSTFAPENEKRVYHSIAVLCCLRPGAGGTTDNRRAGAGGDGLAYICTNRKGGKVLHEGDSIQYMEMNNVYVYPQLTFKNKKQAQQYMRLVNNVKKVLPIAKEARMMLIETTEYLETLQTDQEKAEHMKRVEADIFKTYKPKMKKLTYSQGKLLIKLIDRECHSSSYDMIKAFMGPLRAGFWQVFAWGFGASLKKEYDAKGVDRLTERVVLMVESGQI